MRKRLCVFASAVMLFSLLALPASAVITLKSPAEGSTITSSPASFIFSFDKDPEVINCSLLVDGAVKSTRNTMITRDNNKMSAAVEAGSHTWSIRCIGTSFSVIESEARSFRMDLTEEISDGYTIFYYTTGLRSYVFTIAPGQQESVLPKMIGGDDLLIKLDGKSYYLDVIKMGAYLDTAFVDVRDRSASRFHKLLKGESLDFDFNKDDVIDVRLKLNDVVNGINAYFVVEPYPGSAPLAEPQKPEPEPAAQTPPVAEQPDEQALDEEEEAAIPPAQQTQPSMEEAEPEAPALQPSEGQEAAFDEKQASASGSLVPAIILGAVILVALVILVVLLKRKSSPSSQESKPKRKEGKPAVAAKKGKITEDAIITPEPDESKAPVDEKIDIIKSTNAGGRVRR